LIEARPGDALYYTLHGFMNVELQNNQAAVADLTQAIRLNPVNSNRFNGRRTTITEQLDWQFAVLYFDKIKETLPSSCVALVEDVLIQFMLGNHELCLGLINKTQANCNDGRLLFFRGLVNEYLQHYGKAFQDYTKALVHDSNIFDAHKKRGLLHYEEGKTELAIQDFSEMIRLDSSSVIAYKYRGLTKSLLNDNYGALLDLTSAIALDDTDPELYYNRSIVRHNIQDTLGALADCRQTIRLDSAYRPAYYHYAQMSIDYQQYESAEQIMYAYMDLFQESHKAYNYLGLIKNLNGEYEAAIVHFTQSIDLNPYYVLPHINRGKVYYRLKAYQKAVDDYDEAIVLTNEEEAEVYYLRSLALHKLKKKRKACMDVIRAVKMGLTIDESEIRQICH